MRPTQAEGYLLPYIFAKKRDFKQLLALLVPGTEPVDSKPLLGTQEGAPQDNSPSRVYSPRCFLYAVFSL